MSKEVEIEFKNLLTEQEFTLLKKELNMDDALFVEQTNHYFDTPDFFLKEKGCALRIRERQAQYELTLKEPLTQGLLETNQDLAKDEARKILKTGTLIDGPVKSQLMERHFPFEEIQYFGTLTTLRAETEYKDGLLVLDYSCYLNQHDYEVEYEVSNYEKGEKIFQELLTLFSIPLRPTQNKIQRFYHAKKSNS